MNSNSVQLCARCGARWPVQMQPMQWCPRCNSALAAPTPADAARAPVARRTYRWVARRPDATLPVRRRPAGPDAQGPTPSYHQTPRWGLLDPPPARETRPPTGLAALAERAPFCSSATAVFFALAALAELGRYAVLLENRTRLIPPLVLALSDTAVWMMSIIATVLAVVTAVSAVGWLRAARIREFAAAGHSDPRRLRTLVLGCLVPVVNLVMPGVFLTELARDGMPARRKLVRLWWAAWVLGGAMAVAALVWRSADSLQLRADGVLFTAATDLVAMGVALLTHRLMREFDGRELNGTARSPKRWTPAVGPARPVIEPIRPASVKAHGS